MSDSSRITVATLRKARLLRARGNFGVNIPCALCRMMLHTTDMEFEVEAELDGAVVIFHLHPRCYDNWRETP